MTKRDARSLWVVEKKIGTGWYPRPEATPTLEAGQWTIRYLREWNSRDSFRLCRYVPAKETR